MVNDFIKKLEDKIQDDHGVSIRYETVLPKEKIKTEEDKLIGLTRYDLLMNSIVIGTNYVGMNRLAAIAHEFGHHLDFIQMSEEEKKLVRLKVGLSQQLGISQLQVPVTEFQAWVNADKILKEIGFNVNDSAYVACKLEYFGTYIDNY